MHVRLSLLVVAVVLSGCGYIGVAERDMYTGQVSARVQGAAASTICSPGRVGRMMLLGGPVFWHGPHNTRPLEVLSAEPIEVVGLETVSDELAVLPPDTGGMLMYTPGFLSDPEFVADVLPVPVVVQPSSARYQVVVTVRVTDEQARAAGVLVRYRIGGRTLEDHRFTEFLVKPSCG